MHTPLPTSVRSTGRPKAARSCSVCAVWAGLLGASLLAPVASAQSSLDPDPAVPAAPLPGTPTPDTDVQPTEEQQPPLSPEQLSPEQQPPERLSREERARAGTPGPKPKPIEDVTVIDRLGHTIDGSITLTNAEGELVRISDYFDGTKPAVLAMVYYDCPIVCTVTLQKLLDCFNEIDFKIGEDFNVLIVSFDHTESTPLAAAVKGANLAGYKRGASAAVRNGYNFHTATVGNAKALGDEVGFQFKRLSNGEFSHPVSTIILTPEGTVARYIHGFDLPPRDVELALLEASDGKIATSFGHMLAAFCFRWDPTEGSYSLSAFRVMQLGGIVTVLFLVALVGGLFIWERLTRGAARTPATRASITRPANATAASQSSTGPVTFVGSNR
jgi:protein SCO1